MNFFDTVISVLRMDERFFTAGGEFLRNAVYEAAMQMDAGLIRLLLGNDEMRARFFADVDGTLVFDKAGFGWVVDNRQFLPDSYTRYKNKIGLANEHGNLISASGDVELVFPYKDCVLEGGQTKEDQKRKEVFYNVTLAPDEIDRLLFPKAFCNAARYTENGEEAATELADTDNLIIKGNNLLALSSLLNKFRGMIKCIYIDPPYNTGADSFRYNDSFNHSAWLTFMKNRLEVAKSLLSVKGAIFVHIDYHELGYLLPLMDEIFGKNNCVQVITVRTSSPAGFKTVNPGPIEVTEFILFYTKQRDLFEFKKLYVPSEYDSNYDLYIENPDDEPDEWRLEKLYNVIYRDNGIKIGATPQQSSKNAKAKWGEYWKVIREQLMAAFALENAARIVSVRDPQKPTDELIALLAKSKAERDKVFVYNKSDGDSKGYVYNGGVFSFYSKKVMIIDGVKTSTELLTGLWTDISWDGIANEGSVTLKNGKKPEKLLRRIIEMSAEPNDLIMDFHLGSGTTCAVAHKLGCRYIGIEQLDYGENDSVVRLKSVINGDPTGISRAISWEGGGSFVHCELAKQNQTFAERIRDAKNEEELSRVWADMRATGYICHYVDPRDIDEEAGDFKALSFENKQRLFLDLLDKNLLYVNYCDMDDAESGLTEADKAFTRSFYGEV